MPTGTQRHDYRDFSMVYLLLLPLCLDQCLTHNGCSIDLFELWNKCFGAVALPSAPEVVYPFVVTYDNYGLNLRLSSKVSHLKIHIFKFNIQTHL